MATYAEINDLAGTNALIEKITVAITVAADAILNEVVSTENHAARLVWAKSAFSNPASMAKPFLNALLASNSALTVAQIEGASDTAIQTKVDAAVNIFAGA